MARRLNIKALLGKYGLKPKSSWSQNFLVDEDVMEAIVDSASIRPDQSVIELGSGLGALTAMLAHRAKRVIAVEKDRDLLGLLRQEFAGDAQVEIMDANAAKLDYAALAERLGSPPVVVGNLPYHMATPILFHLLEAKHLVSHWVFMVQKEMADRMLSPPGSRDYGVVSILLQRDLVMERLVEAPPEAFFPSPKVHSTVVGFWPSDQPRLPVKDERMFQRVVRGSFGQRRKKLRNSLIAAFGATHDKEHIDQCLSRAEVDPNTRPEQLSLEQFIRLADAFSQDSQRGAG